MGFASFDDPSWASFVSPGVTVIRQPATAIGEDLLFRVEESLAIRVEDSAIILLILSRLFRTPEIEVCFANHVFRRLAKPLREASVDQDKLPISILDKNGLWDRIED